MDIDAVHYGAAASNTLLNISNISPDQINLFKQRCLDFYIEVRRQITLWIQLKNNPIKGLD